MKKTNNTKMKNILTNIGVMVFLAVFAIMMVGCSSIEHIEDTNGADNYALQTITRQDVVELKLGTRGSISESETKLNIAGLSISVGRKYSSDKFTGVYQLYAATIFKGSDIYVQLSQFEISEGNFAFCIVFDGEIVGQLTPNADGVSEFTLENVEKTGSLEYIIAGESAAFQFIALSDWQ